MTYAGKPLHGYAQDDGAGDVIGQGVGGVWFGVDAEGDAIGETATDDTDAAPSPSY